MCTRSFMSTNEPVEPDDPITLATFIFLTRVARESV